MNHSKSSLSKLAAIASVFGLIGCGGSNQSPANAPASTQSAYGSEQGGSAMSQPTTSNESANGPSQTSPTTQGMQGTTQPYGQSGTTGTGTYGSATTTPGTSQGSQGTWGTSSPYGTTAGMTGSPSSGTSQPSTTGAMGATSAMGGSMDVSSLNDAQYAAILQAINDGEIREAQLAEQKAKSPEVKRFAQHMATDHRDMENKDKTLLSRLQITPTDSTMSNELKTESQNELSSLQGLTGRDFDRDYIDDQVRDHNKALELIDRMVTTIKSSELKTEVQNARPKVEQHLRDAERIQQTLRQGATGQQPGAGSGSK